MLYLRVITHWPIPLHVWENIVMDFVTLLPHSHGYHHVAVDRLSTFGCFIPLKADFTRKIVVESFVSSIVGLYGIPKSMVSESDKSFFSSFLQHLFNAQGAAPAMSSYNSQTDG